MTEEKTYWPRPARAGGIAPAKVRLAARCATVKAKAQVQAIKLRQQQRL